MEAYASHPSRLNASILRVMGSYPFIPGSGALIAGIGWGIVDLLGHWFGYVLLVVGSLVVAAFAAAVRPWFRSGDVCAACVVCESPLLIASFTDLGMSGDYIPAIRIRREPRRRLSHEACKVGRRVAMIARYQGSLGNESWDDFTPLPAQCATSDPSEVERLLSEIDKDRWRALEQGMRNIPRLYAPGLYRLSDVAG